MFNTNRSERPISTTRRRSALTAALVAALGAGIALGASVSGATAQSRPGATSALHFFSKSATFSITTATGKPVKGQPKPGDEIEFTDFDYVGNHVRHASSWTASDHGLCIFETTGPPLCHAQVAIGLPRRIAGCRAKQPKCVCQFVR